MFYKPRKILYCLHNKIHGRHNKPGDKNIRKPGVTFYSNGILFKPVKAKEENECIKERAERALTE
jgi:hypothetical protein